MKKTKATATATLIIILAAMILVAQAAAFDGLYVYKDKKAKVNNYAPSGWMGDMLDIKYSDGWPRNPKRGATCIKVTYLPRSSNNEGWAGIYWQDPPNNWGTELSKYDLTGATKLSFWIRGESGGEIINDIYLGGIEGRYPDSCSVAIGPIELTTEWERYEISLEDQDLSLMIGGFGWSTNLSANPNGCTFYLDEIRYE